MNKNKLLGIFINKRIPFKHFLLIMRLTFVLLLTSVFCTMAETGFSQNVRVTINKRNVALKEVLNEIENQTEYFFIYDNEVDVTKKLSLKVNQQKVTDVLDQLLKGSEVDYFVKSEHIILTAVRKAKIDETVLLQQQQFVIKGKVTDPEGLPLPGVTITIVGTTKGVITDNDGNFSIDASPTDKLVFSFVGMESQVIDINNRNTINIQMGEKIDELEEVTVVAFAKQKKESVISSIETVRAEELRIPSSNLTQALSGRMAGVISYQTSGEPGQDDAQFFIRGITTFGTGKVDPLILIDNVEVTTSDLSRLHPDDIASFSILKDATATALYGARGANGVILITTKEGKEGKAKVSFRFENSFSAPTQTIEMADPITYMNLANEAAKTRNPLSALPYSNEKIDNTVRSTNPYAFPTVDWMKTLTNDVAINQRANLNISGGGKVARYYIAGSFSQDNGILKVDKRNNFNNNIDLKKYLIRSNININLTNSTEAIVRVHGTFDDYTGPVPGGNDLYKKMLRVSPVRFPAYFEPDEKYQYEQHILFGGYGGGDETYFNPYAEMVSGYRQESKTVMLAQLELKQDFSKWLDGLTGRILGNTTRNSAFDLSRSYNPFYYDAVSYDRFTNKYYLSELNTEEGTEYLSYKEGYKKVSSSFYGETSLAYDNEFNKHGVSGMFVLIARNELNGNAGSLAASLPKRNLGVSGRFTYSYDSRYLSEFNFGYNGSEKFDKGHRWGFFPSIGLGWIVSNESFWQGNIQNFVNNLKIKGTYGLVGNDEIGSERFFYLSRVNIGGGNSFTTGYDFGKKRNGVTIGNYANSEIGWEIAYKTNFGIELGLLNDKINIITDIFKERRTNILQPRADIPSTMGLWATQLVNVGEAEGKGIDISVDYNQTIGKDLWFVGRGNFTYARSIFKYYEEPDYFDMPWRSRIGYPISQKWGYVAERLFIDEAEIPVLVFDEDIGEEYYISNTPRQDFGEYGPGDIKYKDINGDGVINEIDMVPIGYPTTPEINYGFGLSAGYKSFDISFFFQGSARSSFWMDVASLAPFVRSSSGGKILETGLAKFIADDYWSETSQNPYALWPRLSNYNIGNNRQRSTWFMQDGSFLRLKSMELGYALPQTLLGKWNINLCRIYISGTNLLNFSKFRLWDVEMGGDGLGYPLQRVINLGVNISF